MIPVLVGVGRSSRNAVGRICEKRGVMEYDMTQYKRINAYEIHYYIIYYSWHTALLEHICNRVLWLPYITCVGCGRGLCVNQ